MKKVLVSAFAAVASAAAFAGMNNVVISFSTPGVDRYSDGTTVENGEKYALVWTPAGEDFAGINANGTPAGNSKLVTAVPVAAGGCCPRVEFQVDEDFVESNFKGGTWSVVMLDTRVFAFDADGKVVIQDGKRKVESVGRAGSQVIGYGVVGAPQISKGGEVGSAGGVAASSDTAASDAPAPKVERIYFDEYDNVCVEVSSAKPAFKYALMSGDNPASIAEKPGADSGYGTRSETLTLVTPKKAGGEFFKVNCKYE